MYEKMIYESIKAAEELIAQYKKELIDAENGTGMCTGLSKSTRDSIAKQLRSAIKSNEDSIKFYKEEIA